MMKKHKILYLGLNAPKPIPGIDLFHFPIIKIIPKSYDQTDIKFMLEHCDRFTHLIFTSKSAVDCFVNLIKKPMNAFGIAVGTATAGRMRENGMSVDKIATQETAEGVIKVLENLDLKNAFVLWPHAAGARDVIRNYLKKENIKFHDCVLYDTVAQLPTEIPNIDEIDEIVFTCPSTVDAYLSLVGPLPLNKMLTPIGPITAAKLLKVTTDKHR